jgi:hypothetical protein
MTFGQMAENTNEIEKGFAKITKTLMSMIDNLDYCIDNCPAYKGCPIYETGIVTAEFFLVAQMNMMERIAEIKAEIATGN